MLRIISKPLMYSRLISKFRGATLIREMLVYTGTNFFNKLFPFLLLPVITRSLSLEGFGEYSIYKATINFAIPITGLCMSSVIVRRYYDKDEIDFNQYISTILAFLALNIVVLIAIVSPFSFYVKELVGISYPIFVNSLLVSFATTVIVLNQGLLRCMNKPLLYAVITIFQAITLFMGIIIYNHSYKGNLLGFVLIEVIVSLLFMFASIYLINVYFKLKFKFSFKYLKDALRFVAPIIPYSVMAYTFALSDRFIISNYLGNKSVAVYSAAFQIASVLQVLAVSFNAVWTPWIFNFLKGKGDLKSLYKKQMLICIAFLVIAILFAVVGPFIIVRFLGAKYENSIGLFKWFVLSNLLQAIYWVINPIIVFYEKNKYLLYASLCAVLISISLNLIFINRFGVQFVAEVNSLSWLITLILTLYYTNKVIKLSYDK